MSWKLEGLDLQNVLEKFNNDTETCVLVLRSFVKNTGPLLKKMEDPTKENSGDYAIAAHGIKGSARGICAALTGDRAEALEKAARAGDGEFITANNGAFLTDTKKLLERLEVFLDARAVENPKPKKDKIDTASLAGLLSACKTYDMDGVDSAMAKLEAYDYKSGSKTIAWLRENVDSMNFEQIVEQLTVQIPIMETYKT